MEQANYPVFAGWDTESHEAGNQGAGNHEDGNHGASEYLFGAFSILLMCVTAMPLLKKIVGFAGSVGIMGLADLPAVQTITSLLF